MFFKKSNVTEIPLEIQPEASSFSDFQSDLSAALDDIAQGHYDTFTCENEELHTILDAFVCKLERMQAGHLERSVELSMQVSEAVISGAEMSRAGHEISDRSSGMAAAVQQLTASVEQISGSTRQVADQASAMNEIARRGMGISQSAAEQMHKVTSSVSETASKIESLVEASNEIADVVGFISDIADKTNLLALNATIEAARAGEAGKGFAVVANEVKELANQTSQNANQIIEKIDILKQETDSINTAIRGVVEAVKTGEESITSTNEEMQNIEEISTTITDQMKNVSGILDEQTAAANEVAAGVNVVAEMTGDNLKQIEHTLDAMDSAEGTLVQQIQSFVGQEIADLTVHLAKSDHVIWKKRLANMLVGRDSLNPDELADHHSCRLGKWYYAISDEKYTSHPAYTALEPPHEKVHFHGIEAAKKYQDGDLAGAIEDVKHANEASQDVLKYLNQLLSR